ncbi:putative RNA-directed DNA polymerase [Tanacetum coccineum]|uniref:RNA-directed DNA polymerase n=1 Tax=Tanacetum coccineum TaxID=301880 RepID=A0ABQ5D2F4_9ASTR
MRGRLGIFLGYPPGTKGHDIEVGLNKTNEPQPESFPQQDSDHDICGSQSHIEDNVNQQTIFEQERVRRVRTQLACLKDFHVYLPPSIDSSRPDSNQGHSTVHPISNFASYDNFSSSHKIFLAAIESHDEPKSFNQAMQDERWKDVKKKEIHALEENRTWTLGSLPKGKHAIDSKWVYNVKYKQNREVERYKARLVAKGFTQREGVDYHDTFAHVAKLVTVRTLLAVATKKNWIINQLDVNNAFLNEDLNEEVNMKIPQGFSKEGETRVCRLRKSLYGLKQASRNWYQKFTTALLDLGFRQCKADYSLFIFKQDNSFVVALIYVDDVIMVGNDKDKIESTKNDLDKRFSIKDLGILKYFLGIEVTQTSKGMVLSQRKYTLDILEDCGFQGCHPSSFPIEPNLKLDKGKTEPKVDSSRYRRMVGRLLYLQATRPNITYVVNVLSQFVADPRQSHLEAAHRVLRYLKATPRQGVLLPNDGGYNLKAYCDSD